MLNSYIVYLKLTLLYTWNEHIVLHQLYFNKKKTEVQRLPSQYQFDLSDLDALLIIFHNICHRIFSYLPTCLSPIFDCKLLENEHTVLFLPLVDY